MEGRPVSPVLYRFSNQITSIIQKETRRKKVTSDCDDTVASFAIPVPVAVLALKPLYEFVFGKITKKLTRKFWRCFEKLIKDHCLWYGETKICAKILLGAMDKNIPILNELKSIKKEDLKLFYADKMFTFMRKYFRKTYVITMEKNKTLIYQTKTWNALAKKNLKARVATGWLKEVPEKQMKEIEAAGLTAASISFIPSGKKLRLVAPIKTQLSRGERPQVVYRDGEKSNMRQRNASKDELREIFSAKLEFIRYVASSESVKNVKSVRMRNVFSFLQNIDTKKQILAKTDVKSAYDSIAISKAYNCFIGKFNHRYGENSQENTDKQNFRWIYFRKEHGQFRFVEKSEVVVFDEDDYKCFRLRDIAKMVKFAKSIPLKWKNKNYCPKFLLHSSPLSSPLAELYIKDMLNVAFKMSNSPDLQITQYMDDILIQGRNASEISNFYDVLKTLLPLHKLDMPSDMGAINFVGYDVNVNSGAVTKKLRRADPNFKTKTDIRSILGYLGFIVKSRMGRCLKRELLWPLDGDDIRKVVFELNRELAYCYKAASKHFSLRKSTMLDSPEDFFVKNVLCPILRRLDSQYKSFLTDKDRRVMRKKFLTIVQTQN